MRTIKIRKSGGFSMMETVVSMFIIGFTSLMFNGAFVQQSQNLTFSESKSEAVIAAQQVIDVLRLEDPSILPDYDHNDPAEAVTVGGSNYDVTVNYCSKSEFCPPNTSDETRYIKVFVEKNSKVIYEVETVFTKFS